jgi:hypothetical protein
MPIILATWEAEAKRANSYQGPIMKMPNTKKKKRERERIYRNI